MLGLARSVRLAAFRGSTKYWERVYARGGHSGPGSEGELARFKATIVNNFVADNCVESAIEFGCGDGRQLRLFSIPRYLGLDVSKSVITRCRSMFGGDPSKSFKPMGEYSGEQAELGLSLDVVYHLVEDDVFLAHMTRLFSAATKYVIVYSTDFDAPREPFAPHVRHREFSSWVRRYPEWKLAGMLPNPYPSNSAASFFVFTRADHVAGGSRSSSAHGFRWDGADGA